MNSLLKDTRFRLMLMANVAVSIGSGITMIAIPWVLVTGEGGSTVFGYATIGMTILNFLLAPFVGQLIDRVSRKWLLVTAQLISLIAIVSFALYGAVWSFDMWHYLVLYVIGSLYYTIFYPTMFALNQEIFSTGQYKALNGAMEIQGQLSTVIAGAAASVLLVVWELHWILFVNAFAYAVAVLFYWRISYVKQKRSVKGETQNGSAWDYVKGNRRLVLLFFFSTMPFIGVMVTNYVFPVYLAEVLETSGSVYGIQGMVYAAGAVVAGIAVPVVAIRWGERRTMIVTMGVYSVAILLVLIADVPVYLMLMFFLAIGNSGTRVARNSLMMDHVPNDVIGRIDGWIRSAGLLLRLALLAVFTGLVSSGAILVSFAVLGALMILSTLAAVILSRGKVKRAAAVVAAEV